MEQINAPGKTLQQFEFFLLQDGGQYHLTQLPDSPFDNFFLCEEVLPADSLEVAGIYAVNGKLIDNCDDGVCIRVSDYVLPYCMTTYENNGGKFGVAGNWPIDLTCTAGYTRRATIPISTGKSTPSKNPLATTQPMPPWASINYLSPSAWSTTA